jgi:acyl carrier protein
MTTLWISPKKLHVLEIYTIMKRTNNYSDEEKRITRKELIIQDLKKIFSPFIENWKDRLTEHVSFCKLGFDTLSLTQIISRIRKKFLVQIHFRQLLEETPNLNSLAEYLEKKITHSFYYEALNLLNTTPPIYPKSFLIVNPASGISATKVNYAIHFESPVDQYRPDTSLINIIQNKLDLIHQFNIFKVKITEIEVGGEYT